MHRPTQDDNSHQMQPDKADRDTKYGKAVKAFVKYVNGLTNPNVVYVFASHDHRYYQAVAGTATTTGFVVSGGAGAPLSGCPKNCRPGAYYHWLQVDVNGASVTVTPIPLNDK